MPATVATPAKRILPDAEKEEKAGRPALPEEMAAVGIVMIVVFTVLHDCQ